MNHFSIKPINRLNKKEYKLFKKMIINLNYPNEKNKISFKQARFFDSGQRILYSLMFMKKNIGFIEVVKYENYVLLDYFYIKKTFRKNGLGSFFLNELKKKHSQIILCILKEAKSYNYLTKFYRKNNFIEIEKPTEIISPTKYTEIYYKFEKI